jgi:hypothetical protein
MLVGTTFLLAGIPMAFVSVGGHLSQNFAIKGSYIVTLQLVFRFTSIPDPIRHLCHFVFPLQAPTLLVGPKKPTSHGIVLSLGSCMILLTIVPASGPASALPFHVQHSRQALLSQSLGGYLTVLVHEEAEDSLA